MESQTQKDTGLYIRLLLITALLSSALLFLNACTGAQVDRSLTGSAVGTLGSFAVLLIPGTYEKWRASAGTVQPWMLGLCVLLVMVSAIPLGLRIERRHEKDKRIRAILAQGRDLGPLNASLRKSLSEITGKRATRFPDFYAQTAQLDMLLDQNKPIFERESFLFNELQSEVNDDPDMSAWVSSMKRVFQSDMRIFGALQGEAACARGLANRSESVQRQFVELCINPQQATLQSAAHDEQEALVSLKTEGVKLPSDVLQTLDGR